MNPQQLRLAQPVLLAQAGTARFTRLEPVRVRQDADSSPP